MQNEKRRTEQIESKSLSYTDPGKSCVYLLQTTGSSKISNQQLTSICQRFPGRHNFAPPPLPATSTGPLTSTQGRYDSARDIPGKQIALQKNKLETEPRFAAASARGSVKGVKLCTCSLETISG